MGHGYEDGGKRCESVDWSGVRPFPGFRGYVKGGKRLEAMEIVSEVVPDARLLDAA